MTSTGAQFEIKVDGVVRSHRDVRTPRSRRPDSCNSASRARRSPSSTCATARWCRSTARDARRRPTHGHRARLAPQAAAAAHRHEQAQDVLVVDHVHALPAHGRRRPRAIHLPVGTRWLAGHARRHGRCTACSKRGVALQDPSWGGNDTGWAPMPVSQMAPVPRQRGLGRGAAAGAVAAMHREGGRIAATPQI